MILSNTAGVLLTGIGLFINAIPIAAPEKVYIYHLPTTRFTCTPQEHSDYHSACAHRKWADERIKPWTKKKG